MSARATLPLDLPAAMSSTTTSTSARLSRRPMTSFELSREDKLLLDALVARTGATSKREAIVTGLRRYAAAEGISIDDLDQEDRAAA